MALDTMFPLPIACPPVVQIREALGKQLQDFEECIEDKLRDGGVGCMDGSPCTRGSRQLFKSMALLAAWNGDESSFTTNFKKALLSDCMQCKEHRGWHTKEAHCVAKEGGNFFKLNACKAAADLKRWGDQALQSVGNAFRDAAKWVETAVKDVGKGIDKIGQEIKKAICPRQTAVPNMLTFAPPFLQGLKDAEFMQPMDAAGNTLRGVWTVQVGAEKRLFKIQLVGGQLSGFVDPPNTYDWSFKRFAGPADAVGVDKERLSGFTWDPKANKLAFRRTGSGFSESYDVTLTQNRTKMTGKGSRQPIADAPPGAKKGTTKANVGGATVDVKGAKIPGSQKCVPESRRAFVRSYQPYLQTGMRYVWAQPKLWGDRAKAFEKAWQWVRSAVSERLANDGFVEPTLPGSKQLQEHALANGLPGARSPFVEECLKDGLSSNPAIQEALASNEELYKSCNWNKVGSAVQQFESKVSNAVGGCKDPSVWGNADRIEDCAWDSFEGRSQDGLKRGGMGSDTSEGKCLSLTLKTSPKVQAQVQEHLGYWFRGSGCAWLEAGGTIIAGMFSKPENLINLILPGMGGMAVMLGEFIGKVIKEGDFGRAFEAMKKETEKRLQTAAQKTEEDMARIGLGFSNILDLDEPEPGQILDAVGDFAGTFFTNLDATIDRWMDTLKIVPFPLNFILGKVTSGSMTGLVVGGFAPLAFLHHATMRFINWLLPKLIIGMGDINEFLKKNLPSGFQGVVNEILKVAGIGAGGIIDIFTRDPKKKERIREIFAKVASVAGKIEELANRINEVTAKALSGKEGPVSLTEVDKMLQGATGGPAPSAGKLGPAQVTAIVKALMEFTKDELFNLIRAPLGKLVGKLLTMLHKLLDIPKNAIGAAIGSIPFAGGILSGIVHFLLGLVIEQMDGFVISKVEELVQLVIGKVMTKIGKSLNDSLGGEKEPEPPPPPEEAGALTVVSARLGEAGEAAAPPPEGQEKPDPFTLELRAACKAQLDRNGRGECAYQKKASGGERRSIVARWTCGAEKYIYTETALEGDVLRLSCPEKCLEGRQGQAVNILSGTYGANMVLKKGNQSAELQKACRNGRACVYRPTPLRDLPKDRERTFLAEYCCAGDPKPYRLSVPQGDPNADTGKLVAFYCRPYRPPAWKEEVPESKLRGFLDLIKKIGEAAKGVKDSANAAKGGISEALGGLVEMLLRKVLFAIIPEEEVRGIIADGLGEVVRQLTAKGGISLPRALAAVFRKIAPNLARFLERKLGPPIGPELGKAVIGVFGSEEKEGVVNEKTVGEIIKSPVEGLKKLLSKVVDELKGPLAGLIVAAAPSDLREGLKKDIVAAIDSIKKRVEAEGFKAILNFRELLGEVFANLTKPLLVLLAQIIPDAQLKKSLGAAVVSREVEALLQRIGTWIQRKSGPPGGEAIGAGLAAFADAVGSFLIGKIPDKPVGGIVKTIFDEVVLRAVKSPKEFYNQFLTKPWEIVRVAVKALRDFVTGKLTGLISDPKLAPEKKLLATALEQVFNILSDETTRNALFGGKGKSPDLLAILSRVATVVGPYIAERLNLLLAGTSFGPPILKIVDGLFLSKSGVLAQGDKALESLPTWLKTEGQAVLGDAVGATSEFLEKELAKSVKSPIVPALVKGILGTLAKALKAPGGIVTMLQQQGGAGVLDLLQQAVGAVVDAMVADMSSAPEAGGQASPLTTMVRGAVKAVRDFFRNPKEMIAQGIEALSKLAPGFGGIVKGVLVSFVQSNIPDRELSPLVEKWVGSFIDFASDAERVRAVTGADVLELAAAGGADLLGYVQPKIVGALPEMARGLAAALLGDVRVLLGKPGELKGLLDGGAKEIVARFIRVLGPPLVTLLGNALPAPAKAPVTALLKDSVEFLGDTANLTLLGGGSLTALLPKLADPTKRFLVSVLGAAGPPAIAARLSSAVDLVAALLASPGTYSEAAGEAARKAIEETLAPLVAKINDSALRELLRGALDLAKDLAGGDEAGKTLRTDYKSLIGRVLDLGCGYLTNVLGRALSDAGVRSFVLGAVDGLREFVVGAAGASGSMSQKASSVLPGLTRRLAGLIGDALQRAIPDARAGKLIGGLVQEGLALLGDPGNWRNLREQGLGFLLSRVVPSVQDYVLGLLASSKLDPVLRGILERAVSSVGSFLSDRESLKNLKKTILPWLVSTVVNALNPALIELIQRKVKQPTLVRFLRTLIESVAADFSSPERFEALLKMSAKQAASRGITVASSVLSDLVYGAISDPSLRKLALEGLRLLFDTLDQAIGEGDLGSALKSALGRGIPLLGGWAKEKLLDLLKGAETLKEALGSTFDMLVSSAAELVSDKSAWGNLTRGGGAALIGRVVTQFLPVVRNPLVGAIQDSSLRGLVSRLFEALTELLDDPLKTIESFRDPKTAVTLFLPKLGRVLKPLVEDLMLRGQEEGGNGFLRQLVDSGFGLLEKPEGLLRLKDVNVAELARKILAGIAPTLLGFIKDEGLKGFLVSAVGTLLEQLTGAPPGNPVTKAAMKSSRLP
jgi:hypothetical protein